MRCSRSGPPQLIGSDQEPHGRGIEGEHVGERSAPLSPRMRLFTERSATDCVTVVRVRTAGPSAAVGRAPACTGARSVAVPPGLPENLVLDELWFRLGRSRR